MRKQGEESAGHRKGLLSPYFPCVLPFPAHFLSGSCYMLPTLWLRTPFTRISLGASFLRQWLHIPILSDSVFSLPSLPSLCSPLLSPWDSYLCPVALDDSTKLLNWFSSTVYYTDTVVQTLCWMPGCKDGKETVPALERRCSYAWDIDIHYTKW